MKKLIIIFLSLFVLTNVSLANFTTQHTMPAPATFAHIQAHNVQSITPPDDVNTLLDELGSRALKNWLIATGLNLLFLPLATLANSKFLLLLTLLITIPSEVYATFLSSVTLGKFIHTNSTNFNAVYKAWVVPIAFYSLMIIAVLFIQFSALMTP